LKLARDSPVISGVRPDPITTLHGIIYLTEVARNSSVIFGTIWHSADMLHRDSRTDIESPDKIHLSTLNLPKRNNYASLN
jgi:hypothetical protein